MWNMESIIDTDSWKDKEYGLCEGVKTKSHRQIEKEMLDADHSNAKAGDTFVTDSGSTFFYNGEEWRHHPRDVGVALETGLDSQRLENLANELNDIMNDWQPESSAVGLDAALNSCILLTLRMYYRSPSIGEKFGDATTGFIYAFDGAGWFNMYDIDAKLGEERLVRSLNDSVARENLGKELGKKIREQHEKEELAALRIATTPTKEQLESTPGFASFGTFDTPALDPAADQIMFYDSDATISLTTAPMSFDIINDNETLVSIDMETGEVEFGENYTPSEAAKIFWDSLGYFHPKNCTCEDVFIGKVEKLWNLRHKTFDNAMKVIGNG